MKKLLFGTLILLLSSALSMADYLELVDGRVVDGTIIELHDEKIEFLKTNGNKNVFVAYEKVLEFVYDDAFEENENSSEKAINTQPIKVNNIAGIPEANEPSIVFNKIRPNAQIMSTIHLFGSIGYGTDDFLVFKQIINIPYYNQHSESYDALKISKPLQATIGLIVDKPYDSSSVFYENIGYKLSGTLQEKRKFILSNESLQNPEFSLGSLNADIFLNLTPEISFGYATTYHIHEGNSDYIDQTAFELKNGVGEKYYVSLNFGHLNLTGGYRVQRASIESNSFFASNTQGGSADIDLSISGLYWEIGVEL
jgi:hypothetical protein